MPNDTMYVWKLVLVTAAGTDSYLFHEKAVARQQLYLHVRDNWRAEFPDDELPEDRDTAISLYFDGNEDESYILVSEEILEEPI